jgi:hypothetical protein
VADCSARSSRASGLRRIGVLTFEGVLMPTAKLLRDELQKLGWIEGRNLQIDHVGILGIATKIPQAANVRAE